MDAIELLDIINSGETSKVQFKEKMPHLDALASEMAAMSNSLGGIILFGVKDKSGEIIGLNYTELQEYNRIIANAATNCVIPIIYITSEVINIGSEDVKKILIVHISEGVNKPYKDKNLAIWVKQGSDKRRVFDNAEILRLFQRSGNLSVDEMVIPSTSVEDINEPIFKLFFEKSFEHSLEDSGLDYIQTLSNLNIVRNNNLTLGGLLFFGKDPQRFKPAFCIKAVSFFGNEIGGSDYRDSKDINGTIPELFQTGINFFISNLKQIQKGQNFNSLGIMEISKIALEELLQNALIHRDYSKNAAVRILIFDDRVEIISPGRLPNSLTVENIKYGNTVLRNNLLATFCSKTMLYRGLGSGIQRSLKEQPNIELINDISGEQFIVKIPRPQ
jgi:predicted HTH transcriptional regulator